jgi:hypothetical protein
MTSLKVDIPTSPAGGMVDITYVGLFPNRETTWLTDYQVAMLNSYHADDDGELNLPTGVSLVEDDQDVEEDVAPSEKAPIQIKGNGKNTTVKDKE